MSDTVKPIKAWAVVHGGEISEFNNHLDIFKSKREARYDATFGGGTIVEVLITPITKKGKQ